MSHEQDAFETLKQQLAVEPSPAFAAKVRAAAAEERPARVGWTRAFALTAAAAVLLMAWTWTMERPVVRPAETQVGANDANLERPVSRMAEKPADLPVAARTERPVFTPAEGRADAPPAEVLVDPADAEAVSRLLAYVMTSPAWALPPDPPGGSAVLQVIELAPMPPIEVRPIVIALLYEEPRSAQGEHQ